MTQFNNGSVIALLSVTYDESASVDANDIDGVLTTYALSDSLTDGTDAISVEAATIIGRPL